MKILLIKLKNGFIRIKEKHIKRVRNLFKHDKINGLRK